MEEDKKKIKQYLYGFPKNAIRLERLEEDLYNAAFGRRYSIYKKENSFEDLIAKKMDLENNIIDWQELIKKVLAFFYVRKPMYANYLKMKFFRKMNYKEIEKRLKIDFERQKDIEDIILEFIYKNAKIRNLM